MNPLIPGPMSGRSASARAGRARQVWASIAAVSTTRRAEPTASGPMNSQNGISSVAVWLSRLLRIETSEAAKISPNRRMPATSIASCSSQRGRGGMRAWNSSILTCPPSAVT